MNKQNPNGMIPWADWTWNPIAGCSPISAGCANCYAAALSERFSLPWGEAHFFPERLGQPAKVFPHFADGSPDLENPYRVFVCSMADLGHETVLPKWREAVCAAMRAAPWHTYIVLTKRPGKWLESLPAATWVGVTVEERSQWERADSLVHWFVGTRFVSVEPMLGPVSPSGMAGPIDWVIAGPETGPGARPCHDEWIEELAGESPCFFDKRKSWKRREFPTKKRKERHE